MEEEILDDNFTTPGATDYTLAENGTRFANYLIDQIFVSIITFAIALGLFAVLGEDALMIGGSEVAGTVMDYVITYILFVLYYTLSEYHLNGKTLGKLITRSRAVTTLNQPMDLKTSFYRSLSRIVPFEAFSFFSEAPGGWHDRWTDTMVIKE